MWPGGICGAAAADGGGGGPTMPSSAAQPVSSASAIALRMAPVDAPPVRFLIGVFLLTAPVNNKALECRRPGNIQGLATGGSIPHGVVFSWRPACLRELCSRSLGVCQPNPSPG